MKNFIHYSDNFYRFFNIFPLFKEGGPLAVGDLKSSVATRSPSLAGQASFKKEQKISIFLKRFITLSVRTTPLSGVNLRWRIF